MTSRVARNTLLLLAVQALDRATSYLFLYHSLRTVMREGGEFSRACRTCAGW